MARMVRQKVAYDYIDVHRRHCLKEKASKLLSGMTKAYPVSLITAQRFPEYDSMTVSMCEMVRSAVSLWRNEGSEGESYDVEPFQLAQNIFYGEERGLVQLVGRLP